MYTNINFSCECGSIVEYLAFYPMVVADTQWEKEEFRETEQETECDRCGKPYPVLIKNNAYEVEVVVSNGEVVVANSEPQYEESELAIITNKESTRIKLFRQQVKTVKILAHQTVDPDAEYGLNIMLFSHLVASAEGYLYSTFLHHVTNSDSLLRRLVETDPEFSKQKFSLSEIFISQEMLQTTIEKYLKDLIFHNLSKTKQMYLNVLGFDFGNIAWFFKAVQLRHHCVHRAGYDKEGQSLDITKESTLELMNQLVDLLEAIEVRVQDFDDEGNRILGQH
ncbi:hypothetical protein [Vibrio sp. Vb2658]|uniref:hypothetical protein n=1 Tax=Vibrio sp. Vb2658 TaxID=3074672 RepID=UPI00296421AC|nr:hypothetical protein [Vibrio sp. Vb2658]